MKYVRGSEIFQEQVYPEIFPKFPVIELSVCGSKVHLEIHTPLELDSCASLEMPNTTMSFLRHFFEKVILVGKAAVNKEQIKYKDANVDLDCSKI